MGRPVYGPIGKEGRVASEYSIELLLEVRGVESA
jgi:hypothetical protein